MLLQKFHNFEFLTAILHRGLRNCFFFSLRSFTFSNFFFPFLFGLLFPFSLFSLNFYFPFSLWTFVSLFSLDFYFPFLFGLLFPFSLWTFIQSRSHFGFLPNFFVRFQFFKYETIGRWAPAFFLHNKLTTAAVKEYLVKWQSFIFFSSFNIPEYSFTWELCHHYRTWNL